MKYINKSQEPEIFATWKGCENEEWKPTWDNFQSPEKPAVHQALLQEQGYICCYCGMRIAKETSHIEHLQPQEIYPDLTLNYSNLLASCPGEGEDPDWKKPKKLSPYQKHCGSKKDNWYNSDLMVSPLQPNCDEFFRYTGFGEILPSNDLGMHSAANETINRLGLNDPKLQAARRKQIQKILPLINGCTKKEIEQLAKGYDQLDGDGKYTPFCFAIAYILNQYFIDYN